MRPDTTAAVARRNPFSLVDLQRRVVRYLRVSVTDRCNYRCTYCMPAQGVAVVARDALLEFEEIERIVRVFVELGVTHVRLTGGEPLVRRGIVDLVRRIASIDGVKDLAMTTNGHLLPSLAGPLRDAGLQRLNVSIDTLDAQRFAQLTRQGDLATVLDGLRAAHDAGFRDTKLNAVVLRGFNDDEAGDLLDFAAEHGHLLRLIEYMPIGLDDLWGPDTFVSSAETSASIADRWRLRDIGASSTGASVVGGGPARYAVADRLDGRFSGVKVGFISAVSHNFCRTCNRVRLSSTGTLRECLSTGGSLSLRDMLRAGEDDNALGAAISAAMAGKVDGHRFDRAAATHEAMSSIGG